MLKKGHVLFISFLTWCLTMPISAWAVDCTYKKDATFVKTLQDWAGDGGMCWFCPVFETLFKSINSLVTDMSKYMSELFLTLMGIGILFLIAFKVGRMLVQLQDVDLMQFLGDLFKPLGRAIIATALLGAMTFSGDTIYHLLIQPIFDLSLFLGEQILNIAVSSTKIFTASQGDYITVTTQRATDILGACTYRGTLPDHMAFTSLELQQFICWLRTVSASLGVGIALGSTFIKIGFSDFWDNMRLIFPGIFIFITFFINYLSFPLKLIDSIVRLAFVLMLTPLWIILWVFPVTVQYTKKAWDMFLGSCFTMISLSIIVALILQIMNSSIQPSELREDLFKELTCDLTDNAVQKVEVGGATLFIMLALGFISWSLLRTAPKLASIFANASGDLGVEGGVSRNMMMAIRSAYKGTRALVRSGKAAVGASRDRAQNKDRAQKGKKKDTGTPSTPPAPRGTFPESPAGGTAPETGANDSKETGTPPAGGTAPETGENNSIPKQDGAKPTNQASSDATSAREHFERVVRDLHSINITNQNAADLERAIGKAEAENYRNKAVSDIITNSPNAYTEQDKVILQNLAQEMHKSFMSVGEAVDRYSDYLQKKAEAENAGRAAGKEAGQKAGATAGYVAGSQGAKDEINTQTRKQKS